MADQRVNINIGTSYSGEGMQKAMGAVNNMSRVAGQAAGAVGSIGGAIGSMGGEASKAVGSISRLMGALAAGGPLGLAVAGVTALVSAFISWREEAKKVRDEQDKMKFEAAKRSIDSYQESVNALATSLEKVAKFQATFNNTLASVQTNQATVEATQALIAGEKGGTAVSRAEGQRNATAITQAQNIKNAQTTVGNAKKTLDNANKAADAQAKAIAGLEAYAKSAQESVLKLGTVDLADEEGLKELSRRRAILSKAEASLAAAKEKEQELTNAAIQANNEYVKAQEALNATKAKAELENIRAENAVVDAKKKAEEDRLKEEQKRRDEEEKEWEEEERARQEAIKETWEQVTREKERNDAFREQERMEKKLREEIAKEPKLREELNRATEDLKNAEYDLANKLRNLDVLSRGWRGGPVPEGQIIGNGFNSSNRYGARNNVSKNDAGYNERIQAGYERNARSQGYGLSASEQREYDNLTRKFLSEAEGKTRMSDKERQRMHELAQKDPETQRAKAERAALKAQAEKDKAQDAKDVAEKKMQSNVQEIVTLMKKLGLS